MSSDLETSARRLRAGLLAAAMGFVVVLAVVTVRELQSRPAWRRIQSEYRESLPGSRLPVEVSQFTSCTGEVNRCRTCHLGLDRPREPGEETRVVFGPHPRATGGHLARSAGCTSCHGGTGRALDSRAAHAQPGTEVPDPRMRQPFVQASCARCHTPGDRPGQERLVRGARLYLGLGCGLCHPLDRGGRGGWDFGPDLRTIGRKSIAYLRTSLLDPAANFPRSTMPAFDRTFRDHPGALEDLVVFLASLPVERADAGCSRRGRSLTLVHGPCTRCHAGEGGRASGRFVHACLYLLERADRLACRGCHPGPVPRPGRFSERCPVVTEHRGNCPVCHDGSPASVEPGPHNSSLRQPGGDSAPPRNNL